MKYLKVFSALLCAAYAAALWFLLVTEGAARALPPPGFFVWTVLPSALLLLIVLKTRHDATRAAFFALQLILSAAGIAGYYDALHLTLDPQSALALIFFPLYQMVVIALCVLAAGLARVVASRRAR